MPTSKARAWHRSLPQHLQAQLVGNRTLQTELGVLASEAAGRSVSYNLTFQRSANGQVHERTEGVLLLPVCRSKDRH